MTHLSSNLPAPSRMHSLNRTSPKGGPFIGVCSLCGKAGLTLDDIHNDECENPRGLSQDDAVVEAIVGPVPNRLRFNFRTNRDQVGMGFFRALRWAWIHSTRGI